MTEPENPFAAVLQELDRAIDGIVCRYCGHRVTRCNCRNCGAPRDEAEAPKAKL